MRTIRLLAALTLALSLTGCIGSVVGVAVDTTTAVIKAPFQITGAVVGVAADTTGTVIATPFRMASAAVGGGRHNDHDKHIDHDHEHPSDRGDEYRYQYPAGEHSSEH